MKGVLCARLEIISPYLEVSMAHEDKLIQYLSKEIETQSKNLMTFRERINFALYVGPFVLLGATLYGKNIPRIDFAAMPLKLKIVLALSLAGIILSYLFMGIACSVIEGQMWDQCNKWRDRIWDITTGKSGFEPEEVQFKRPHITRGYVLVYCAMIVAFMSAIIAIFIFKIYGH
jgi:NhaP-type Na+/H+ or K+/H+ antiporter